MNKAFHNLILIAATASGLSLAVASCADDKELSDQEKQQQIEQQSETDLNQAAEFWNVVGQLTDDPMPDDWQHATYAPSIGEPDGESTTVRIVSTADAETAAARFAQLTGANINENTQDYSTVQPITALVTWLKRLTATAFTNTGYACALLSDQQERVTVIGSA